MSYKKSRFVFTQSQRNGIFVLVILILLLFGGMVWVNQSNLSTSSVSDARLQKSQNKIDSIKAKKISEKAKRQQKIYPFNPNFISDYKGYKLGLSVKEIDRLHNFRKNDKWINSIEDFQKVTKVSDSLLNEISPYFKFPTWVIEKRKSQKHTTVKHTKLSFNEKKDLNSVSGKELQEINGVGPAYSKRIIRYRAKIGGFVANIQLKDIYGLNYETEQKILEKFTVKNPPEIQKININNASVIDLSEIIYFDYELARQIINYRELHEGISSFEELAKIENFPSYKIERIKLYLYID